VRVDIAYCILYELKHTVCVYYTISHRSYSIQTSSINQKCKQKRKPFLRAPNLQCALMYGAPGSCEMASFELESSLLVLELVLVQHLVG
jgi:hypothetical protein